MKKMSIKLKLIIIFIFIKVIPVILIAYIGIQGTIRINEYFMLNTEALYVKNRQVIETTASESIDDSVEALDSKSQESMEKLGLRIASEVAEFLYERDKDLLFLSSLNLNQNIINNFFTSKTKAISVHSPYVYNDKLSSWQSKKIEPFLRPHVLSELADNQREFRYLDPVRFEIINLPLYKEVVFFNTRGEEIYKRSSISKSKKNISKRQNTYIQSERYFENIQDLKKGEIYVSDVIGSYVKSNLIGKFTKVKAKALGLKFEPEKHAYAGLENPVGKRFEGIIRFITPIYQENKKIGYLSLALDHRHIMEFTDSVNPTSMHMKQNIADASAGNYAFMWDYEGRNISHPRDYFIVGYDPKTGEQVPGWMSHSLALEFKESKEKDLNHFLSRYPKFYNQSLSEKPNLEQLKEKGEVGLDCRYLNFAPQCKGWMELTQNGGFGSFIIYWSNVWKLTTAATIPYYTGQYKNSKRGFGFVSIGANVDEFHSAANKTKENIKSVIKTQTLEMEDILEDDKIKLKKYVKDLINELILSTIIMIVLVMMIAVWMSNYISNKITKLINGTKEFSHNNLDYHIEVTSSDEIGELEQSFNDMAMKLKEDSQKIQEQDNIMSQQSKMASMGEMLENIAHQWRQPLSIISTAATGTLLQKDLKILSDENMKDNLNIIALNAQHLSKTIDDFRNFFNPNKPKSIFNLEETFDKACLIVSSKFKNQNITIYKVCDSNLEIFGLDNELIQVFINILNNARDAFEIKDQTVQFIFVNIYQNDSKIYIKIKDNAGGIEPEALDRVFEPYFTTKFGSQGTGIGLYMSFEIIEKHMKGHICVKNKTYVYEDIKYKGAEFTIELPINRRK